MDPMKWLRRQAKAAIFGGRTETMQILIVAAGAVLGYRIAKAGKGRTIYSKNLREGMSITISRR
jgi:hypothetical protein